MTKAGPKSQKLAESLSLLKELQDQGHIAIRSAWLSRTHRERLLKKGYLQEVIKGWYIPANPLDRPGDTTTWYSSFWPFCTAYLNHTKGTDWCLAPEASIELHTENWQVPKQLVVRSKQAGNNVIQLPFGSSLIDLKGTMPMADELVIKNGVRLFSLPMALVASTPSLYRDNPSTMQAALLALDDADLLLAILLAGNHSVVAGRLVGAFKRVERDDVAAKILAGMRAHDHDVRETDPFNDQLRHAANVLPKSPYVQRLAILWQNMRQPVIDALPDPPAKGLSVEAYLHQAENLSTSDAYHSLSIEGYKVSEALIEKIKLGQWQPTSPDADEHSALAARGYWQARLKVIASIKKIVAGEQASAVVDRDLSEWFAQLFEPSVKAGIHRASEFIGYRTGQVFIRHSRHVPPGRDAVRSAMPAFFELLAKEPHPGVQAVLGHFFFVYIHPYPDGNGRTARFLMNAFLAGGGYPWVVIPVGRRSEYFAALESASTNQDIVPFAKFISGLISSS